MILGLWVMIGGCLAGPLQQLICLAWAILYTSWCKYSFAIGFRWYLQCLIQPNFLGPSRMSAGPCAADNLSGRGHCILYMMYCVAWNWFLVVPPMFDRMHFLATFWGPQGPHAAGALRQTSISAYSKLHNGCWYGQILVPCSFNQNALGCPTNLLLCVWKHGWNCGIFDFLPGK